jgi:hypothetical protein
MPYLENKKMLLVFIRNMVVTKICENYERKEITLII